MTNNQTIALSAVAATTAIGFAALLNVGSGIDLTAFSVTPNTADTLLDNSQFGFRRALRL